MNQWQMWDGRCTRCRNGIPEYEGSGYEDHVILCRDCAFAEVADELAMAKRFLDRGDSMDIGMNIKRVALELEALL